MLDEADEEEEEDDAGGKDTAVAREGTTVLVRLAVAARVLEDLPNASGADLPL